MTTQAITQNINAQSITWAGAAGLWAILRTVAIVLGLAIALGGLFAVVVAFWWPICQVAGCLAIVAAYGYLTFPRSKAVRR